MASRRCPTSGKKLFEDHTFQKSHSVESSRMQRDRQLYEKRMLDSSSRCLRLVEESINIAFEVEEELQSQEESFLRIEATLNKIDGDMDIANRQIKSLKSVWGAISSYFRKPLQPKKPDVPAGDAEMKQYSETKPKTEQVAASGMGWEDSKDVYHSRPQNLDATVAKNLYATMSGLTELKSHGLLLGGTTLADKIEECDRNIRKILTK